MGRCHEHERRMCARNLHNRARGGSRYSVPAESADTRRGAGGRGTGMSHFGCSWCTGVGGDSQSHVHRTVHGIPGSVTGMASAVALVPRNGVEVECAMQQGECEAIHSQRAQLRCDHQLHDEHSSVGVRGAGVAERALPMAATMETTTCAVPHRNIAIAMARIECPASLISTWPWQTACACATATAIAWATATRSGTPYLKRSAEGYA